MNSLVLIFLLLTTYPLMNEKYYCSVEADFGEFNRSPSKQRLCRGFGFMQARLVIAVGRKEGLQKLNLTVYEHITVSFHQNLAI